LTVRTFLCDNALKILSKMVAIHFVHIGNTSCTARLGENSISQPASNQPTPHSFSALQQQQQQLARSPA
jgi:hypothetical protein